MKYTAYIITIALLRLVALLPKRALYLLSDFLFFILYRIAGYRKEVVKRNLHNAFPGKTEQELLETEVKFYRHLADVIIENAVIQFYSRRRLEQMFSFTNPEMIDAWFNRARHIILVTAHYNNWEWASPLSYTFNHLVIGVYKPLKNPWFDRALRKARTRFGAAAVPMGNIGRALFEYREKGIPTLTGMVGDQRPIRKQVRYWTDFLNQKTAVFTGSEKLAQKFNAVVIFMKVRRIRRGQYSATFQLVTDRPSETSQFEITEQHTRFLEELIHEEPANWLWSHNRWKISYEQWLEWQSENRQ
jgi:KDO2-lipid IV(A) lauroyltransferase